MSSPGGLGAGGGAIDESLLDLPRGGVDEAVFMEENSRLKSENAALRDQLAAFSDDYQSEHEGDALPLWWTRRHDTDASTPGD